MTDWHRGTGDRGAPRRTSITVPATREEFEREVATWISRLVMSRTPDPRTGQPMQREEELVIGNSTLQQVWQLVAARHGTQVPITAILIWDASHVVRIQFETSYRPARQPIPDENRPPPRETIDSPVSRRGDTSVSTRGGSLRFDLALQTGVLEYTPLLRWQAEGRIRYTLDFNPSADNRRVHGFKVTNGRWQLESETTLMLRAGWFIRSKIIIPTAPSRINATLLSEVFSVGYVSPNFLGTGVAVTTMLRPIQFVDSGPNRYWMPLVLECNGELDSISLAQLFGEPTNFRVALIIQVKFGLTRAGFTLILRSAIDGARRAIVSGRTLLQTSGAAIARFVQMLRTYWLAFEVYLASIPEAAILVDTALVVGTVVVAGAAITGAALALNVGLANIIQSERDEGARRGLKNQYATGLVRELFGRQGDAAGDTAASRSPQMRQFRQAGIDRARRMISDRGGDRTLAQNELLNLLYRDSVPPRNVMMELAAVVSRVQSRL
jgi:hypothetical protein